MKPKDLGGTKSFFTKFSTVYYKLFLIKKKYIA